jgi:hypothetical protein
MYDIECMATRPTADMPKPDSTVKCTGIVKSVVFDPWTDGHASKQPLLQQYINFNYTRAAPATLSNDEAISAQLLPGRQG